MSGLKEPPVRGSARSALHDRGHVQGSSTVGGAVFAHENLCYTSPDAREVSRAMAAHGEQVAGFLWRLCEEDSRRVRFVAKGTNDIRDSLARLAGSTTHSIRNAVVWDSFDGSGRTTALNAAAHRRGVIVQRVVNPATLHRYALLPLTNLFAQRVVVAPVRQTLILSDHRRLVFAGPRTDAGEGTMFLTEDADAISAVRDLTDRQIEWGEAIPVLPASQTNRRRLQVLILLLAGQTDATIARRLDVSNRSVEKDVAAIKDLARVGTRMELVWALGYGPSRP